MFCVYGNGEQEQTQSKPKRSLTYSLAHSLTQTGITGVDPFARTIISGVKDDLETMDTIVLPIALLILGSIVKSLPLMLIPVVTILTAILGQFLVMYPVALSMDVVSFAPSIMMSLTIAMSIDYSLFLLSRFTEEVQGYHCHYTHSHTYTHIYVCVLYTPERDKQRFYF